MKALAVWKGLGQTVGHRRQHTVAQALLDATFRRNARRNIIKILSELLTKEEENMLDHVNVKLK